MFLGGFFKKKLNLSQFGNYYIDKLKTSGKGYINGRF